jgi:hypothetical protein
MVQKNERKKKKKEEKKPTKSIMKCNLAFDQPKSNTPNTQFDSASESTGKLNIFAPGSQQRFVATQF